VTRKRAAPSYPHTPDGRYFIVNLRLWRLTNPNLAAHVRENWVSKLMKARRQVGAAGRDSALRAAARRNVDLAKRALGERGEPWWRDGAPDYNRRLIANTPYASWFASSAIEAAILKLLTERDQDASTCPSEIARALAPTSEKQWRSMMPLVRKVASTLAREQRVRITRGAETLDPNDLTGGPIRIRRGSKLSSINSPLSHHRRLPWQESTVRRPAAKSKK
jgi:hypothetical protein